MNWKSRTRIQTALQAYEMTDYLDRTSLIRSARQTLLARRQAALSVSSSESEASLPSTSSETGISSTSLVIMNSEPENLTFSTMADASASSLVRSLDFPPMLMIACVHLPTVRNSQPQLEVGQEGLIEGEVEKGSDFMVEDVALKSGQGSVNPEDPDVDNDQPLVSPSEPEPERSVVRIEAFSKPGTLLGPSEFDTLLEQYQSGTISSRHLPAEMDFYTGEKEVCKQDKDSHTDSSYSDDNGSDTERKECSKKKEVEDGKGVFGRVRASTHYAVGLIRSSCQYVNQYFSGHDNSALDYFLDDYGRKTIRPVPVAIPGTYYFVDENPGVFATTNLEEARKIASVRGTGVYTGNRNEMVASRDANMDVQNDDGELQGPSVASSAEIRKDTIIEIESEDRKENRNIDFSKPTA